MADEDANILPFPGAGRAMPGDASGGVPVAPGGGAPQPPPAMLSMQGVGGVPMGQIPPPEPLPIPDTTYVGDYPSTATEEQHSLDEPVDVDELRKQYTDYVTIKQNEILEAHTALQYYHGDQWDEEQLDSFQARGQPAITFNRISRKIDGLVGVLQRLRGDPKGYGRTMGNEKGAEVAEDCVRYALDQSGWRKIETEALRMGSITGIVVTEKSFTHGDKGDVDIMVSDVDPTTFFYDPRSMKKDFSDCRYMGVAKLVTKDEFDELFPPKPSDEEIERTWEGIWAMRRDWDTAWSTDDTGQTLFDQDRYFLWSQGRTKLRLVEHWYRSRGEWYFAFYAGSTVMQKGRSPFFDHKGKTLSRYNAFAVHIDNLGDHYGMVRNMFGPQDAMNQHRSKAVHIMNTRQLVVNKAALGGDNDLERLRKEIARPDGVVLWEGPQELIPKFEMQEQEFLHQTSYFQDAKQEIDSFGPNPALVATNVGGPADVSGRSIAMQQQAGLAELGSFPVQWRMWKTALYSQIWANQQRYITTERVLRLTNDQGVARYLSINKPLAGSVDPWGRPLLVNAVGQIDVDIVLDDGPDVHNIMGDVNDTLIALAHNNVPVPPQVIIQTSNLPQSMKKELLSMVTQQDPMTKAAAEAKINVAKSIAARNFGQAQVSQAQAGKHGAEIGKVDADTKLSMAKAVATLAETHQTVQETHGISQQNALGPYQQQPQGPQPPPPFVPAGGQPSLGSLGGAGLPPGGPPGPGAAGPPTPPIMGGPPGGGPAGAPGLPPGLAPGLGPGGPPPGLGPLQPGVGNPNAAMMAGGGGPPPIGAEGPANPMPQPQTMPPPEGPPWGGIQLGPNGQYYIPDPEKPGSWWMVLPPQGPGPGGM